MQTNVVVPPSTHIEYFGRENLSKPEGMTADQVRTETQGRISHNGTRRGSAGFKLYTFYVEDGVTAQEVAQASLEMDLRTHQRRHVEFYIGEFNLPMARVKVL